MSNLFYISPDDPPDAFPPVASALDDPPGLLAAGGDLSTERLLAAYRCGIFPWYSDDQPILWWSPDPRCILWPQEFKCSRSLAKALRNDGFTFSHNTAFEEVMRACADTRLRPEGSWIHDDMVRAYVALHQQGYAHSLEVWRDGALAGGLYGVQLGGIFFGESMFSRVTDASKVALYYLCEGFGHRAPPQPISLIDCQMPTRHLLSLGAKAIARAEYLALLRRFT